MPADFRIFPAQRLIYSRVYGVFTYRELRDHMLAIRAHPDFDPACNQLFDGRRIDSLEVTDEEMVEIASIGLSPLRAKRALIAATPCVFGLFRMYEAYSSSLGDSGVRVYSSFEEAADWLGIAVQKAPGRAQEATETADSSISGKWQLNEQIFT